MRRVSFFSLVMAVAAAVTLGVLLLGRANSATEASLVAGPPFETPQSDAAAPDNYTLSHFKCWTVEQQRWRRQVAYLQDQFDVQDRPPYETVAVGRPEWFCNATSKQHGNAQFPVVDERDHLTCYQIQELTDDTFAQRSVLVSNQFGEQQQLQVVRPRDLCVPTDKMAIDGKPIDLAAPTTLDHFKCYDVQGKPVVTPVRLQDEFDKLASLNGATHFEDVRVGSPVLLCNPTRKVHFTGFGTTAAANTVNHVDIQHPTAHLVCYRITPSESLPHRVLLSNQFGPEQSINTVRSDLLCTPSLKRELK